MDEDGTWVESEIYMYVKEEMKTQEREGKGNTWRGNQMRCGEERASSLWTGRLIPNMEQIECMTQNACL